MCIIFTLYMQHSGVTVDMKYQNSPPPHRNYVQDRNKDFQTKQKQYSAKTFQCVCVTTRVFILRFIPFLLFFSFLHVSITQNLFSLASEKLLCSPLSRHYSGEKHDKQKRVSVYSACLPAGHCVSLAATGSNDATVCIVQVRHLSVPAL